MSPQCLATKITLSRFQIQWYNDNKDTKHGTLNSFIEITKSLMSSDLIFLTHVPHWGKGIFFPFVSYGWLSLPLSVFKKSMQEKADTSHSLQVGTGNSRTWAAFCGLRSKSHLLLCNLSNTRIQLHNFQSCLHLCN